MLAIPKEYIESICEVKTLTNDLLAMGVLIKIDIESLEIAGNNNERMPLLQYRTPVKIYVHSYTLGSQVLAGTVYLSTENFLRLEDVQQLSAFERRGAFRVNSSTNAVLRPYISISERVALDEQLASMSTEEKTNIANDEDGVKVHLLDVSLTGARINSPILLRPGTRYILEFTLFEKPAFFNLKVQRIIKTPNGTVQYGGVFFEYSDKALDFLCRDLFQMQRIEKSKRRDSPV